ncbi:diguanylate cyclase (GGDEF)-like protein [Paraburkholderia sp. GAS448]|uniref:diguanylate cyclase n=1 Tax=Paraburkholderia sp. GAS448 TaxID=3035136 RepID=UPI003D191E77
MLIRHIFRRLLPWLVSPWFVIAGGVLMALTMLVVCAVLLYDGREDALALANESSLNTLLVVERDIARNVELYDLSLQAVVDGVGDPEVMALPRALRDSVLFERAATAKDLGSMLVLDSAGNVMIDSGSATPRQANFADRSYFTVHRDNPNAGLYLSPPFRSRLRGGDPSIALSRRINKPDGSFGGIVLGTFRLEYFHRLLAGLQLGPNGTMALIHTNGQLIMRSPDDQRVVGRDLSGTRLFLRMNLQPEGRFSDESPIDGIRRVYTFRHLPGLPLIMEVAPAEMDIYAAWRVRAIRMAILITVFGLIVVGLAVLLAYSLAKKAQAERMLTMLSRIDSLTGLYNRRSLDDLLKREWQRAKRSGEALSILFVDIDHFKAYNDGYGHQAGDDALACVARCISGNLRRPGDSAARYGGEEFVIVLPATLGPGAFNVAETIRDEVFSLGIEHAGSEQGRITVSIGVATWQGKKSNTVESVVKAADEALYSAKAAGRNSVFATILA